MSVASRYRHHAAGSALTILLGVAALIVLIALSRNPVKAAQH
ncbi:MAG: hypothetical protein ACREFO_02985 [Acetobacteraceae bacterium]